MQTKGGENKMKNSYRTIILILLLTLLTINTGCWNRRELNELSIVTGAGIDPGDKEGEITFVYQIINPSAIAGQGVGASMTPFITLKTSGKTEFAAARRATREISRRLYFGHLQVFLINSEIAEQQGIKDLLDFLYRDPEIREDIPIFITKEQPVEKILSTQSILEINSGISIKKHLENVYKSESCSRPVELREVINLLTSDTSSLTIPTVHLSPPIEKSNLAMTQDAKQASIIKIEGFSVFKKDKLIGVLNSAESRALNWIMDEVSSSIIVIPYEKKEHSIEVLRSKTAVDAKVQNGKPEIAVNIEMDVNIGEMNGPVDLTKVETIKEIEQVTNKTVEESINKVIQKAQEKYKVDIFRFGEVIERHEPKEWKKLKENWEEEFTDLKVTVNVDTRIRNLGMKNVPFQEKMTK